MSKEDHIELDGLVTDAMGGGQYKVLLSDGNKTYVRAVLSGKMKQKKIRVLSGDRVMVNVSPYDLTHGFITYRYK